MRIPLHRIRGLAAALVLLTPLVFALSKDGPLRRKAVRLVNVGKGCIPVLVPEKELAGAEKEAALARWKEAVATAKDPKKKAAVLAKAPDDLWSITGKPTTPKKPAVLAHWLAGVRALQGERDGIALKEWGECLRLSPQDEDCARGIKHLEMLASLGPAKFSRTSSPAGGHWRKGLAAYQAGRMQEAHDEWRLCPEDQDCLNGLQRIDAVYHPNRRPSSPR